jgi:hypothetical protein
MPATTVAAVSSLPERWIEVSSFDVLLDIDLGTPSHFGQFQYGEVDGMHFIT